MKTKRHDSVKGYKLDFASGALIVNYKFHKALSDFGSPEYQRYQTLRNDFPHLKVVVKAGRTITTTRPNKRLTYENMEQYISAYSNAEELMEAFRIVKLRSKPLASPYKYVVDWFHAQFPDYKAVAVPPSGGLTVMPIEAPDTDQYKQKDDIAA